MTDDTPAFVSGGARVRTNALKHRGKTVGALRRQRVGNADFLEEGRRIKGQDVCRLLIGEQVQQHGDQAGDDHRVGAAAETDGPGRDRRRLGNKPDLARTAAHLVGVGILVWLQGRQGLPEIDQVGKARFPVIEEGEVFAQGGGLFGNSHGQGNGAFAAEGQPSGGPRFR